MALCLIVVQVAVLGGGRAVAEEIYPLVFPVVGDHHYSDTWGAARSGGRTHEGTDIMADKMTPVVAAASGTVGWIRDGVGTDCCMMALNHDDGWTSWYIHLNNDTPGTDDGMGFGFAAGIERGVRVEAGQLIGWVGDSGNAESTAPHLHFELHQPGVGPINPYVHLLAAEQLTEPGAPTDGGGADVGAGPMSYTDIGGSVFADDIEWLAARGITVSCDADGEMYCPDEPLTREHMAALLARALSLNVLRINAFSDISGLPYEQEIGMIAEAGVTLGCGEGRYCPQESVTRAQMATFLVRAFGLTGTMVNPFLDDEGNYHEADIATLAHNGITLGCDADDIRRFCPEQEVTRGQMAAFIARAMGR